MNDRNVKPSAIAEEPHRIYSWEDVRYKYYPWFFLFWGI